MPSMIDFIALSNDDSPARSLEQSLHQALGGDAWRGRWQFSVVDGTTHDLFTGYNTGARQTSGEILAFIHHEVLVLGNAMTFDRPLRMLQEEAVGFIGVCGSTRLNSQGSWWGDMPAPQVMSFCRGLVGCGDSNPF